MALSCNSQGFSYYYYFTDALIGYKVEIFEKVYTEIKVNEKILCKCWFSKY